MIRCFLVTIALLFAVPAYASVAVVSSTIIPANQSGGTSSAINTTGATVIALYMGGAASNGALPTDSVTGCPSPCNTWTAHTSTSGPATKGLWYTCVQPCTVGTNHVFVSTSGSPFWPTAFIYALSGTNLSGAYDSTVGAQGSADTGLAAGTITPTAVTNMILTGFTNGSNSTVPTVATPFDTNLTTSGTTGASYLAQSATTPQNPTWTAAGNVDAVAVSITIKGPGASIAISLSPSIVTAGTASNVISITGTLTSFSGSPFTIAGSFGSRLVSQTVTDATHGTITVNPGAPSAGNITVTDTISSATVVLTVDPPVLGALKIGWIGDSITAGSDPTGQATTFLSNLGYTVTSVNAGQSGTTTADWVSGSANLISAKASFAGAGVTLVHYMLGTNDWKVSTNYSAAASYANTASTVHDLVAAGYKVVISQSPYIYPNDNISGTYWINDPNAANQAAFALDLQLVDGVNVFQGDRAFFAYSTANPATFTGDGVHPKDATQYAILGNDWGFAIANKVGVTVSAGTGGSGHIISGWLNKTLDPLSKLDFFASNDARCVFKKIC